jgi:hypothetical protein
MLCGLRDGENVADKDEIDRVNRQLRAIGPCEDEFSLYGACVYETILDIPQHFRLYIDRIDLPDSVTARPIVW